jgi:hypothetical protein
MTNNKGKYDPYTSNEELEEGKQLPGFGKPLQKFYFQAL